MCWTVLFSRPTGDWPTMSQSDVNHMTDMTDKNRGAKNNTEETDKAATSPVPGNAALSGIAARGRAELWQVSLLVPAELAPGLAELLEPMGLALQVQVDRPDGLWAIRILTLDPPDMADLQTRVALFAAPMGYEAPVPGVESVPADGWLARSARAFPPLRVGRFFIHGSHFHGSPPVASQSLRVDAATAFGSGEHGTTAGCLRALERLARTRQFNNILDLGTGSGLLAMAAARVWPATVMATDLDGEAVRVARLNAWDNRLGPRIRFTRADGYDAPMISRQRPYDLIMANILARPLRRMARDLAAHLAPGGMAVLSGFMAEDRNAIAAIHRSLGVVRCFDITIDGWSTMVLRKP